MRGAPISLLGGRNGVAKVKDYITTYCRPQSHPTKDRKINIKYVTKLPLRMILFIIARLTGRSTLHVARKSYMEYGLEYLELTLFNWSGGVLVNMKENPSKEKEGKIKKFVYGAILVSFTLEWVPLL